LEIVVLDKLSDKLIRMEVQPKHTIGSIIETIIDKQKLDKNKSYKLTLGNQSFGRNQYLLSLQKAGIKQGDHLFLEAEIVPEIVPKVKEVTAEAKPEEKEAEHMKFCVECGTKMKWIQQYERWYCYKCHKYQAA